MKFVPDAVVGGAKPLAKAALLAHILVLAQTANADDAELHVTLSSDMAAVDYQHLDMQQNSMWGAGAIYNEESEAWGLSGTFNVMGNATMTDQIRTGIGLKAILYDTFQTAGSLAVGGSAEYAPDALPGFGIEAQAYFAPQILSTNDTEQYREAMIRATYDFNPRAEVYVGLERREIRYDTIEVPLADGLQVGLTLTF